MDKAAREEYFLAQEDELLKEGAAFSEWCTFISKSVYDAFVNGADLATIITALVCIETYLKQKMWEAKTKIWHNSLMKNHSYPMMKRNSYTPCESTEMDGYTQIGLTILIC